MSLSKRPFFHWGQKAFPARLRHVCRRARNPSLRWLETESSDRPCPGSQAPRAFTRRSNKCARFREWILSPAGLGWYWKLPQLVHHCCSTSPVNYPQCWPNHGSTEGRCMWTRHSWRTYGQSRGVQEARREAANDWRTRRISQKGRVNTNFKCPYRFN